MRTLQQSRKPKKTRPKSSSRLSPPTRMPNAQRSSTMRAVRSSNTAPELSVREVLRSFRYRPLFNSRAIAGTPDAALPRLKKAIFVHGCFWHGHKCQRGDRMPKTNRSYWRSKIARNIARDARVARTLRALGWDVLVVWECQTHNQARLSRRVKDFIRRTA